MRSAVALLGLFLVFSPTQAQESRGSNLAPKISVGDRWQDQTQFTFQCSLQFPGAKNNQKWLWQRWDRQTEEVQELDDGRLNKIQRSVESSESVLNEGKKNTTDLHGLTLILSRDGEETGVEGGEDLSSLIRNNLQVESAAGLHYPEQDVEEGSDWEFPSARFQKFLNLHLAGGGPEFSGLEGNLSFQFSQEEKSNGINLSGETNGTLLLSQDGKEEPVEIPLSLKWRGSLSLAPSTRSPRSLHLAIELAAPAEGSSPFLGGKIEFTQTRKDLTEPKEEIPSTDGIRLAANFTAGEKWTHSSKTVFEATVEEYSLVVNDEEIPRGSEEDISVTLTSSSETTDEVLEAEDGEIKKVKRTLGPAEISMEGEGFPVPEEMPNPRAELEGAVIILERDGDDIAAEVESGEEIEEAMLRSMGMGDDFKILLPEAGVKVGDTWNPDEKKLLKQLTRALPDPNAEEGLKIQELLDKVEGSLQCTLEEITEEEGASLATVTIAGELEISIDQEDLPETEEGIPEGLELAISVAAELEGTFVFNLKTGKPRKLELAGPLTFAMTIGQVQEEIEMEFKQTMKATGSLEIEQAFSTDSSED